MSVHKEHMPSDVELHYKTISYTQKHKQRFCNTNNKLFMILYNLQLYDVLYAVSYRIFVWEGGWGSECTS